MSLPSRRAAALLLLAACSPEPKDDGADSGDADDSADTSADSADTSGDSGDSADVEPDPRAPWEREVRRTPGPLGLNELHYHPAGDPDDEWLELHNPLAIDLDVSAWTLEGAVAFTFPEGSRVPAGGFVVVAADPARLAEAGVAGALGPYTGRLDDDGDRLEVRNQTGRLIDSVGWDDDDPWPVGADGSGATLARRSPSSPGDLAESWTFSATLGGTPGADNRLDPDAPPTTLSLVPLESTWAYDLSADHPSPDWAGPSYDDAAWPRGDAVFYAGAPEGDATGVVWVTADNYYAVYLGEADGTNLRLVAEDADGDWTTVESYAVDLTPRDHLYLAAWEAPWDYGGPQMVIAEVEIGDDLVGTAAATFEWTLGPTGGCPGTTPPDPPPGEDAILAVVEEAEAAAAWEAPAVEAAPSSDPWGWATGGWFDADTRYVWPDTFGDTSITNVENTYALVRSVSPLLGDRGATELGTVPTTARFRTTFALDADPAGVALSAECVLDDGAVLYLNGVEVLRHNLPSGPLDASTLATEIVIDAGRVFADLPTDALVRGENLLAVELHQAEPDDADLTFGCALTATIAADAASAPAELHEVGAADEGWAEVRARTEVEGLVLASSAGERAVPAASAGERVLVEELTLTPGELLFLYDADRTALLDAVRVGDRPRGRDGDAGPWRYVSEPTPGEPNRVSVEDDVVIHEIQYHHAPVSRDDEPVEDVEEEWIELYNRGTEAVDLGGWQLVDAVGFTFPSGTTLGPGEYLVVAENAATVQARYPEARVVGAFEGRLDNSGDRILLLDAAGNPADEVWYHDGGRWPEAADGGGSTLELRDPWADNAAPEAWAASDESGRAEWTRYTLRGVASRSAVGPDGTWNELVIGLLDAGEVLIDDVSVVQNPGGSATQVLPNGTFDAGADRWRILGNHRHSEVVPDPDDPANPVLRLRATGPTGHMHNHAETTLDAPIREVEYEVSFRARWVSGSNQLHTRLYFHRLPHAARLPMPEGAGTPGAANGTAADLGPTFDGLSQDRAVPPAHAPVRVSVAVSDPDGVAEVTLWSVVDGGAPEATAMTEGDDGRWSATLAGQPGGTIVQMWVEAVDGRGLAASFPAGGPDSRALFTFDDGRAATNGLHNLRILMTPEDIAWMHEDVNLMSDDLVGATVVYDEAEVFHDVGVRLKGSERGRPEDARIGYALRFHPDRPLRGRLRSVLVDRSEGVGYGQREVLMNLVMTGAGSVSGEYNDVTQALTPLPQHVGPAELQLDRFTDLVLDAQFADGAEGRLYEYELVYYPYTTDDGTAEGLKMPQPDGVVGTPITDLGDDPEAWRWTFLLQNNEVADDFAPIMEVGRVFASPDFVTEAATVLDVDQWLRGFAFATLSGAIDNWGGDGSWHNAQFYVRPEDGRALFFPHDLDFYGGSTMPVVGNGDLARLLTEPAYLRGYYGHLADIIGRAYNTEYLGPWCERLDVLLAPQDFASHCAAVADRAQYVMRGAPDAVLTRFPPVDFAITTNGGEAFTVDAAEATLEGVGWVDVRAVTRDGVELPLTWVDEHTWRVVVALQAGANEVRLVATDLRGAAVGGDVVVITATKGS